MAKGRKKVKIDTIGKYNSLSYLNDIKGFKTTGEFLDFLKAFDANSPQMKELREKSDGD